MIITVIKIGRHEYEITEDDEFMDNGFCVQLRTQSKVTDEWGRSKTPKLSKRVVKEISKFPRIQRPHEYGSRVSIFSLGEQKQ